MKKLNIFNKKSTGGGKLSTLLVAFIMLLIVTSSTSTRAADIDDEFVFGILKYKITSENPKTVTLVKYDGDEPSGELVIPATVTYEGNSYSVTAIGDKVFQYCTTLTSVTIPKSVTSIGNYAFQFCANLPFVTIPEGVTSIGESAFYYCSGLISVTIPEGVTSIGRNAFYDVKHIINKSKCTDGRPWGALLENGTIVGDFVYEDDTKVKLLVYIGKGGEVTIPKGVTSIGNIAFSNCTRLTSITIPEGVTSIGDDAFYNCASLTSVTIPEGVKSIGENAFRECTNLTSITIPKSVTSIGYDAFWGCTKITDVYLYANPDNLTWLENYCDDFITNPKGATKCHVLAEYLDKYATKFKDEVNVTFVTTLGALTITKYGYRTTATLQGEFTSAQTPSLEIKDQIEVDELTFQRSFIAGVPATIMLPFDFTPDDNVGKFYTLQSVEHENGVWTATMSQPITGTIQANTPYIFMPTKDITPSNNMTFTDITLKSTSTIEINTNGDWTLHGVYEKTLLDGFNQINYGFAGQATDDGISVGDFIRAGEGVWADPMRCYLTYTGSDARLAKSAIDLPDRIRVVFPDEVEQPDNGEIVTPVSEFTPENGVKVWSYDGTVYIEAQPDMDYTIVDLTGRTIKKSVTHSTHEELNLNTKGIVIVKIGNKSFKIK